MTARPPIAWGPAAAAARAAGTPLVALESSVLAQGLPVPANAEADRRMRAAIAARGAAPVITAMVRGTLTLGLEGDDLARFLRREGIAKVSARDLPVAAAQGRDGATTVAGTLAACVVGGLDVFATGGIGGVHREPAFDESADLDELGRTSAVVVCAGAKSILDLPATLERLESRGITLVGYRTEEFPGFFTASTGLPLPASVDSAAEVAALLRSARALRRPGAVLVVQPPPPGGRARPRDGGSRGGTGAWRGPRRRHPRCGAHAVPARGGGARHRRVVPARQSGIARTERGAGGRGGGRPVRAPLTQRPAAVVAGYHPVGSSLVPRAGGHPPDALTVPEFRGVRRARTPALQ